MNHILRLVLRHTKLSFALAVFSAPQLATSKTIAFIGDSISTGAVTNPALSFNKQKLWRLFRGQEQVALSIDLFNEATGEAYDELGKPKRLWPSLREYFGPSAFASANLINAFSTVYLDTEQYSWSYMVGRSRGYDPDEILIAAQDGARMEAGIRQLDRVLDYTEGKIPDELFIFFTGNDLCGPSIDMTKSARQYSSDLSDLLRYLLRNGNAAEGGSDIYVLGFMGIMQLTTSPEILDKEVVAHGKKTTCREFDKLTLGELNKGDSEFIQNNPEAGWFMTLFPNTPVAMCPTVFNANPDKEDGQKSMLANRIRSIRSGSKEVVENYKKIISARKNEEPVRFHFIEGTGNLVFKANDIAADCFHLSIYGQQKIAETVMRSLEI